MVFKKNYVHTRINGKWVQAVVKDGVMYDMKGKMLSKAGGYKPPTAKQIGMQVGGALRTPKPADPENKKGSNADLSPEGVVVQNGHIYVKQRQAPNQVQQSIRTQSGGTVRVDPVKKERQRKALLDKMNRNLLSGKRQSGGRISIL